jgi:hypothetical protein
VSAGTWEDSLKIWPIRSWYALFAHFVILCSAHVSGSTDRDIASDHNTKVVRLVEMDSKQVSPGLWKDFENSAHTQLRTRISRIPSYFAPLTFLAQPIEMMPCSIAPNLFARSSSRIYLCTSPLGSPLQDLDSTKCDVALLRESVGARSRPNSGT